MSAEEKLAEMISFGRHGKEIHPFMFQPIIGRSNVVSAAIRLGKSRGVLVEAGKNGIGKPFYRLVLPSTTHSAPEQIQ